jgi:hypothetical protein
MAYMEQLIGTEIGEVWQDDKDKTYYAVAFMNKGTCAPIHSAMIRRRVHTQEPATQGSFRALESA